MNRPIILDNVTEKRGGSSKLFCYDYKKDMNIIDIGKKQVLYLNVDKHVNEIRTSTRVSRECDDEEYSFLELLTKTEVTRERDDEEYSFLELQCKTFVERERDDEQYINFNQ